MTESVPDLDRPAHGWRYQHGAYYYRVPPALLDHWDGKTLFRLATILRARLLLSDGRTWERVPCEHYIRRDAHKARGRCIKQRAEEAV
jgi:hypothetical protein